MSFILDALRKSESDRQQKAAPTLAEARYDVRPKRPNKWIPIVALLLGVNASVIVLAVLYNPGQPEKLLREGSVEKAIAAAPQPKPISPERVRPLAEEAQQSNVPSPVRAVASAEPAPVSPDFRQPPPDVDTGQSDPLKEGLPGLQQLALAGIVSLPPLHLDMHVYSPNRSQRFIFINMSKYKENERIEEGPMVEEITETGVILNHQGNRFFLDRE
jgi:general secretion pathway protein B